MKKIGLMSAVLISGAAFAADGIKLGGFADVGFAWTKDAVPEMGFGVGTGAFYFGKTMGAGEVLVDLPFSYNASGTSNAILAGFGQAQAFVSWAYDNGFMWKMGQFDSLFGAEANDSWDRFFSETGLLASMVPTTHTGLALGYKASDSMNATFLVSNTADKGAQTASADAKFDFGVKVESMSDAFNVALGAYFAAAGGTGDYAYTLNAVGSSKMGQLGTVLELNYNKAKDLGVGAHFDYSMNEDTNIGAAVEWMKVDAADTSVLALRVGPKFTMTKDFNVRIAYQMAQTSVGSTSTTDQGLALNAVHRF